VAPAPRPTYLEAVTTYERGLEALQRHDYVKAAELLKRVIERFPDERELTERARLYLKVCERQLEPVPSAPRTVEERVYAATLAINTGAYDEAVAHLRRVDAEAPDNDAAQYMLAVAYSQRGDPAAGLGHLRRAIELNPENRSLARQDPDLEAIRAIDGFRSLLEATTAAARRRARQRTTPR
jgi:tetratricopeptide (TPR) repeat protein